MKIVNVPKAKDPQGHYIKFARQKLTGQLHLIVDNQTVVEPGDLVSYEGSDDLAPATIFVGELVKTGFIPSSAVEEFRSQQNGDPSRN